MVEFYMENWGGRTSVRAGKVVIVPGMGKYVESSVMKTLLKAVMVVKP